MKFNKKSFIILSVVVLLLILSIIFFAGKNPDNNISGQPSSQQTGDDTKHEVSQTQTGDSKQKEKAPSLKDCESITGKDEKTECVNTYYYYEATNKNDPKICEKVTDDLMRGDCRAHTLLPENNGCNDGSDSCKKIADIDEVIKKDDVNSCIDMGDTTLQSSCTKKFLITDQKLGKMDKTCSKITNTNLKKLCLNNYYLIIAQNKKDPAICSKITDPLMSEICARNIKYEKISNNDSPSSCDTFKDAKNREECIKQKNIEAFTKDPQLEKCDAFSGAEKQTCLNFYYLQKALSEKDKSLCSQISIQNIQEQCIKSIK